MSKRVLVLDFDHKTRKSTVALLQRRGIEVVEAGSMDEFTRALIPGAPDVAIVEPELPGADSSELCSLIHGSSIGSPAIILASHSLGSDALRYRASQVGAKLFFERPISDTELVQAIADALAEANATPASPSPKVAPAKMPGAARTTEASQRSASTPKQVELTKIGNSDFEGWLDDVFSGIEGEAPPTPAQTAAEESAPISASAAVVTSAGAVTSEPKPSSAGEPETLDFGELIANKPRPQAATSAPGGEPGVGPEPLQATVSGSDPGPVPTPGPTPGPTQQPTPEPGVVAPQPTATPPIGAGSPGTPVASDVNSFVDTTPSDLPAWSPDAAWEPDASAPAAASQPIRQGIASSDLQMSEIPVGTAQTGSTKMQTATPATTEALGYIPPAPRGNAGLLLSLPLVAAIVVGGFFVWQNYGPSPIPGLPFAPKTTPAKAAPESSERTLSEVPETGIQAGAKTVAMPPSDPQADGTIEISRRETSQGSTSRVHQSQVHQPQVQPSRAQPPMEQRTVSTRPQTSIAEDSSAPILIAPATEDSAGQVPTKQTDRRAAMTMEPKLDAAPAQQRVTHPEKPQQATAQNVPDSQAPIRQPPVRQEPIQRDPVQEQVAQRKPVKVGTFDAREDVTETTSATKPPAGAGAAPIERMADPFEFVRKTPVPPKPVEPKWVDGGVASMVPASLIESSRVQPRVPAAAARMGTFGEVVMQVQILSDGSVGDVTVLSEPNRKTGLGKAAVAAVRQWRYRPATVSGEPAETTTEVRIRFTP